MIKMLELREMIRLVSKSSIQEFNLKNGDVGISMKKPVPKMVDQQIIVSPHDMQQTAINEAAATVEVVAESAGKEKVTEPPLRTIVSKFIGVFSSSSPGAKPYVKVGDKITTNSIIGMCNVEALKLSQEILSDINGEIAEVLVDDGEVVDYGQPLFVVKPE